VVVGVPVLLRIAASKPCTALAAIGSFISGRGRGRDGGEKAEPDDEQASASETVAEGDANTAAPQEAGERSGRDTRDRLAFAWRAA
jgi:hypothetical protein